MINEHDIADMKPNKRKEVLDEASSIVNGARTQTYGGPEDSFKQIGALWAAYLNHPVSAVDVSLLLGLMKVARLKATPTHHDSWVDIAGYAACGAECAIKE